jgi:hypothetical protein
LPFIQGYPNISIHFEKFILQVLLNTWRRYCDLFFGLYPSSLCFVITTFRGMALPQSKGEPNLLGPIDRAESRWIWWRAIYRLKGELSKLFSHLTGTRCEPQVWRGRCQIDNPTLPTLVTACHR